MFMLKIAFDGPFPGTCIVTMPLCPGSCLQSLTFIQVIPITFLGTLLAVRVRSAESLSLFSSWENIAETGLLGCPNLVAVDLPIEEASVVVHISSTEESSLFSYQGVLTHAFVRLILSGIEPITLSLRRGSPKPSNLREAAHSLLI